MKLKRRSILVLIVSMLFFHRSQNMSPLIIISQNASNLEKLAAKELRRYLYQRTDQLLPIIEYSKAMPLKNSIFVATKSQQLVADGEVLDSAQYSGLGEQEYFLKFKSRQGRKFCFIIGGDDSGVLYGTYRFIEHFGIRFYLHGDVIPDEKIKLDLPEVNECGEPLFVLRGVLPFHDFPEGPDWWNLDDYKAVIAQLPKMRLNFIGFHNYPERKNFNGEGNKAEPLVWIGLTDHINPDGTVKTGYPAMHFFTSDSTWGYAPCKTSDFHCGAAQLFECDHFGADYMKNISAWPHTESENICLFNDVGSLLHEVFSLAKNLKVKTCLGTEAPLTVPDNVKKEIEKSGKKIDDKIIKKLYQGIFERIKRTYPLDYYWLWTTESWTWDTPRVEEVKRTEADLSLASEAAQEVETNFRLATCGWVLGPPNNRAEFDNLLSKEIPFSCINREVGFSPVEPTFQNIDGRPTWAIPWLEDDPALISPQLWVGRTRKDAVDALTYGCSGLMGIHWRTKILSPNLAALAQAGWEHGEWRNVPLNEGERDLPTADFYLDWASANFGKKYAPEIAAIFSRLDGGPLYLPGKSRRSANLLRSSDWIKGPGGIRLGLGDGVSDSDAKKEINSRFDFIQELESIGSKIKGSGETERLDYWLNSFRYTRATLLLGNVLDKLDKVVKQVNEVTEKSERKNLVKNKALPLRLQATKHWQDMMSYLLATVSSTGELGTIANLEQHNLRKLNVLGKHDSLLTAISEEPLPNETRLSKEYGGPLKIILTTNRSLLEPDEDFKVTARILSRSPIKSADLHWRFLGEKNFRAVQLKHVSRGVYHVAIPKEQLLKADFEYYVEAANEEQKLVWPVTAEEICQAVVVMPFNNH